MTPFTRKLTLTAHVTFSVDWIGALAVFLAHALASVMSHDEQMIRAASLAMGLTAWFVILPLSLASLVSGLVQALGTAWGLLRHYWIVFKLLLTSVATIVLLLKLQPISALAEAATQAAFSAHDLAGLRTSLTVHAVGGLVVLLAVVTLAIYKPAGLTWYGSRGNRDQGKAGTPRWVKVFGSIVVAFIVLVGGMALVGSHGPGAHLPASADRP